MRAAHTTQVFSSVIDHWETQDPGEWEPDGAIDSGSADTVRLEELKAERRLDMMSQIITPLLENSERTRISSGERILMQGEPAPGLILIDEGYVEIRDRSNDHLIDIDGPGCLLGEMSLLTGRPCSADVVAKTPVIIRMLPAHQYEDACTQQPKLEYALGQLVSVRLGKHHHDALCGKSLGGYSIQRCINRGGMGVIYQATDSDGRPVALKMLMHKFIDDESMHKRFDQEAKMLGSLDHPNIVQLHHHFLAFRTRFLVLQLCDGSDLLSVLHQHKSLCEKDVRAILGQIASGLLAAHTAGIWHQDLKPANILITRDGHIHITDFGLSRLREIDVSESKIVGTPVFMAPEQFVNTDSGPAGDWYALACMTFELLTGNLLFAGHNVCELYQTKAFCKPEQILKRKLTTEITDELFQILVSALQPDFQKRNLDLNKISKWSKPVPHLL